MLIVLCGLPGTGKSTLARALTKRLKGVIISSDSIRLNLLEKRTYSKEEKFFIYEKMFKKAEEELKKGKLVILDATFYLASLRERARAIAEKVSATAVLIECILSEEEVWKRMLGRKMDESEADFSIYKKIKGEFNPITERHLIINCALPLEEQLRSALGYLKKFAPNYIDTHISKIYFIGDFVYKIKKPLKFSFLDFSTLQLRKFYCGEELRLNRRLCPDVYLDIVKAEKHFGGYLFESNVADEYAVKMRRLPMKRQMDKLLEKNKIDKKTIEKIATVVDNFHKRVEVIHNERYGNAFLIRQQINDLAIYRNIIEKATGYGDYVDFVLEKCILFNKRNLKLFKKRQEEGFIRDCHGDLHSANIIVADKIYIFDCIEFNKDFRFIDVASEIAFMAMDLEAFGKYTFSEVFVKTYVDLSKDQELLKFLDYYKCYRANVRLKVAAIEYSQNKNKDAKKRMIKYAKLMKNYAEALTF